MQAFTETLKPKGRYRITECNPAKAMAEYMALCAFAKKPIPKSPHGKARHAYEYRALRDAYHAKAKVAEHVFDNLVPTVGRSVLAQRVAGTVTYSGTINYAALGSNTAVPANGDTQLGTEVYRQLLSSQTYVNNIAYLSAFIPAGSATGTHYEAGLFIDGSGSANSGVIFSHVALSPAVVKGALNSLTLDVTITFT